MAKDIIRAYEGARTYVDERFCEIDDIVAEIADDLDHNFEALLKKHTKKLITLWAEYSGAQSVLDEITDAEFGVLFEKAD